MSLVPRPVIQFATALFAEDGIYFIGDIDTRYVPAPHVNFVELGKQGRFTVVRVDCRGGPTIELRCNKRSTVYW